MGLDSLDVVSAEEVLEETTRRSAQGDSQFESLPFEGSGGTPLLSSLEGLVLLAPSALALRRPVRIPGLLLCRLTSIGRAADPALHVIGVVETELVSNLHRHLAGGGQQRRLFDVQPGRRPRVLEQRRRGGELVGIIGCSRRGVNPAMRPRTTAATTI